MRSVQVGAVVIVAALAGASPAGAGEAMPQWFESETAKLLAAARVLDGTPLAVTSRVERGDYIQEMPELEPGWCERMLEDFRTLRGVEAVEPVKAAGRLGGMPMRNWDGFCPNLMNSPVFDDEWLELWHDPPTEPGGPVVLGETRYFYSTVRDVRLFRADFDGQAGNGHETILAWRRTMRAAPATLPPGLTWSEFAKSRHGEFRHETNDDESYVLLDFDRHGCSLEPSAGVGEVYLNFYNRREYERTFVGIVRYGGRFYLYSMAPQPIVWDLMYFRLHRILQSSPGPETAWICRFEEPDRLTEEEKSERQPQPLR